MFSLFFMPFPSDVHGWDLQGYNAENELAT